MILFIICGIVVTWIAHFYFESKKLDVMREKNQIERQKIAASVKKSAVTPVVAATPAPVPALADIAVRAVAAAPVSASEVPESNLEGHEIHPLTIKKVMVRGCLLRVSFYPELGGADAELLNSSGIKHLPKSLSLGVLMSGVQSDDELVAAFTRIAESKINTAARKAKTQKTA